MTSAPPGTLVPTRAPWWRTVHPWAITVLLALAYLVSLGVGRSTRPEGSALALVWPAAAVGLLWLAWARRFSRPVVLVNLAAITVIAATVNAVTGMGAVLGAALGVCGGVQAVVGCVLVRRLQARGGTPAWRLRRLSDLWALAIGSYAGAAAAAVIGTTAMLATPTLALADPRGVALIALAWVVRLGTSAFVLTAVALRLADPEARREVHDRRAWGEKIVVAVALVAAYAAVFGQVDAPPLAFATLSLSMAVALRFRTTTAALHVVVVGTFVVVATLAGRGPFAVADTLTSILLAQGFVTVVALATMVLALYRDEHRELVSAVARTRDQLAGVLGGATEIAIIGTDLRGRITVFNTGAQRLLGYDEQQATGTDLVAFHDDQEIADRAAELGIVPGPMVLTTTALRGEPETRRWTYLRHDGSRVQVMLTVTAIVDELGAITGFMGVARDLSDQLSAQEGLADSEQRFRLAFETAPIGMMMIGLRAGSPGAVLRTNPAMSELLGHSEAALMAMNVADLTHPDDLPSTRAQLQRHAGGEVEQHQCEQRYVHADGSTVWVRLSTAVIRPHDDEPYALDLVEDITARRRAEQALTHQALHDPLTGLPNRSLFADRLQHALAAAVRTTARVGVLYLDLDGFKGVNDTAGHAAGDEVLQHVADRLSACIRPGDTLARLGGDEFAVVCPGLDSGDDSGATAAARLRVVADRVLETLQAPIELSAGTFAVGVSVGMAVAECGGSAEDVMQQADEAMYGAKRTGRNRVLAHDSQEQARALRAATMLPELVEALARDELVMFGQPVVDLASGDVVAVETLIRWQHPTRGLLSPAQFLDVAEASSLMLAIGRRVLDESCRMAATWVAALGPAAPCVHVNVWAGQLNDSRLVDETLATLARHDLPGRFLVLELTETNMPLISHSLLANLERLRRVGVRIAIDDIGTGYSSLARLTELPVDILKIDLSFVAGLGTDRRCDAIVRAILGIGQALGLEVVAEGVETLEQAALLRGYDCDTVQGYLYSPPRSEGVLAQQLRVTVPSELASGLTSELAAS